MAFIGFYFQFQGGGSVANLAFDYSKKLDIDCNIYFVEILPSKSVFNRIFDTLLVDRAVKFHDKVFLPNRTLEVVSKTVDGTEKFFLALNSVDIEEVFLQHDLNNPYIIEVLERGTIYLLHDMFYPFFVDAYPQMPSLIIDLSSIPNRLMNKVEIDVRFDKIIGNSEIETRFFKSPVLQLYDKLNEIESDLSSIEYVIYRTDTETENLVSSQKIPVLIDNLRMITNNVIFEKKSKSPINLKTFMHFVDSLVLRDTERTKISTFLPYIGNAFQKKLSVIGIRSLNRLKKEIYARFCEWNSSETTIRAPMVSLCQSSGFGKSKVSIELIKRNPGLYTVFRKEGKDGKDDQSGFPPQNVFSKLLKELCITSFDLYTDLNKHSYEKSSVGKILDFLATYLILFIEMTLGYFRDHKNKAAGSTDREAFEAALSTFASLFEINDSKLFRQLTSSDKMRSLYQSFAKDVSEITVSTLADFIESLVSRPSFCKLDSLDSIDSDSRQFLEGYLECLTQTLDKFPFVFIMDEADVLIEVSETKNGLEYLRRAISYLPIGARFIVLTLGTKSDILTLNPPVIDTSSRFAKRNTLPSPIILSSNVNIYSTKFPIHEMVPSYSLLKNGHMIKFLASLGRGLWSSYPFGSIVESAAFKLKNGNIPEYKYLMSVWMIRTGIMANPVAIKSSPFVAIHMATLFAASDDLRELIVSYPSEPILALASRLLIKTLPKDREYLFTALKDYLECVSIDNGKYSEVFASMTILLNVDELPNVALVHIDTNDSNLQSIKDDMPRFKKLWDMKWVLGQKPDYTSTNLINFQKELYSVHTLGSFLQKWIYGSSTEKSIVDLQIPEFMLQGLINITHFVPLVRDNRGFTTLKDNLRDTFKVSPEQLPLASNRANDPSRNVIDRSLLQIGLARQCGFMMPDNYYGYDCIIPVCLKSNEYTFIGVQVKRSGANLRDDIFKMQARVHYVKCPNHGYGSDYVSPCCTSDETLQKIYGNQISLLISLDEDKYNSFTSKREFLPTFSDARAPKASLEAALKNILPATLNLSRSKKTDDNFLPLIHDKFELHSSALLSTCIWDDSAVKTLLPTANGTNSDSSTCVKTSPELVRDKFIHRQFCFVTRGWGILNNLENFSKDGAKVANEILSSVSGPFKRKDGNSSVSSDIVRSVVYDIGPSYMQYSDELVASRTDGRIRNLNELDIATGSFIEEEQEEEQEHEDEEQEEQEQQEDEEQEEQEHEVQFEAQSQSLQLEEHSTEQLSEEQQQLSEEQEQSSSEEQEQVQSRIKRPRPD